MPDSWLCVGKPNEPDVPVPPPDCVTASVQTVEPDEFGMDQLQLRDDPVELAVAVTVKYAVPDIVSVVVPDPGPNTIWLDPTCSTTCVTHDGILPLSIFSDVPEGIVNVPEFAVPPAAGTDADTDEEGPGAVPPVTVKGSEYVLLLRSESALTCWGSNVTFNV